MTCRPELHRLNDSRPSFTTYLARAQVWGGFRRSRSQSSQPPALQHELRRAGYSWVGVSLSTPQHVSIGRGPVATPAALYFGIRRQELNLPLHHRGCNRYTSSKCVSTLHAAATNKARTVYRRYRRAACAVAGGRVERPDCPLMRRTVSRFSRSSPATTRLTLPANTHSLPHTADGCNDR